MPVAPKSGQLTGQPGTPLVQPGGSSKPWPFSADLLAERLAVGGYVQKPVIDALKAEASASSRSLVDLILERKQMSSSALRDAMSRIFGLPVADLATVAIDPAVITKAPAEFARTHLLLPLHAEGDRLVVVCADPTQAEVIRTVRRMAGLTVDLRLASRDDLAPRVYQYFSPRLVVLLPSGQTMDVVILAGEMKIGRADHNDLVLPDPTVGSTHAILRAQGNDYQIVDFGSRNGVFVDNARINQAHLLKNGDVIKIGQCLLTFKLPLPDAAQSHDGATQILTPDATNAAVAALLKGVQSTPVAAKAAAAGSGFVAGGAAAGDEEDEKQKKKDKKRQEKEKKEKEKVKEADKLKSAWIGFVGRIIAQIVGAVATIVLGLMIAGKMPSCSSNGDSGASAGPPAGVAAVDFVTFGETNPAGEPYNASAIVEIAPGKFIFADNNTNDALFELNIEANGTKAGPLVRRPLVGVQPGQLDDIEGLALAQKDGKTIIFATTSMMNKISKKQGQFVARPARSCELPCSRTEASRLR
ncbi:MAG: FHA domain-containing protein [Blastocatellia bacterium]|nr:FHA domain-containing protein [Blastocatellia bacterium]